MLTGPGASIAKARKLRREMALPEVSLWQELRKRPSGYKFRKQHLAGPFVLDFVCPQARLVIEIDGEAHDRARVSVREEARDEWVMAQGFRTLCIPAREVLRGVEAVLAHILAHCQPLHHPASPGNPPPRSGEDL